MKDKIMVAMLGGFSMSYKKKKFGFFNKSRSAKNAALLEYLAAFKGEGFTRAELIEILWGELGSSYDYDSKIKADNSSFKVQMSRLRDELEKFAPNLTFIEYDKVNRVYSFNPSAECVFDFDEFEKRRDFFESGDELKPLLEAIELYKGDFLPNSLNESWSAPFRTHYRFLYIEAVLRAIELLEKENDAGQILSLCEKALSIEPENEIIKEKFSELTRGLQSKRVNEKFENVNSVVENLYESGEQKGAYFCDYEAFKRVYALEVRHYNRNNSAFGNPENDRKVSVFLLSLTNSKGETPKAERLNLAMAKLSEVIASSLRIGDAYAEFSPSQYAILLRRTDDDICKMILERLKTRYKAEKVRGAGIVNFRYHTLVI